MEYTPYPTTSDDSSCSFEFISEGPKGRILKRILYRPLESHPSIFNLGFGDVRADGSVDYNTITNNGDVMFVFATVASTIPKFLSLNPGKSVFVKGHTDSRNRLYRRVISNHLRHITDEHYLLGLVEEKWYPFEKEQNYSGFIVQLKNPLSLKR